MDARWKKIVQGSILQDKVLKSQNVHWKGREIGYRRKEEQQTNESENMQEDENNTS